MYQVLADTNPLPTEQESQECDEALQAYLKRYNFGREEIRHFPHYSDAFRAAWFESRLNTKKEIVNG